MIKCILTLTLGAILFAASVNAQTYGTISRPDIFGNQSIRYNNGVSGTLSRPDIFGNSAFRYNNGINGTLTSPDIFGNRTIQIHNNRWGW